MAGAAMKELLGLPLTTQEKRVARKAAKRWGQQNPSFVDVIDQLTPDYASRLQRKHKVTGEIFYTVNREPCRSVAQVARWHRVKTYAMSLISEEQRAMRTVYGKKSKRCKRQGCDHLIVQARTYCSRRCHREDKRAAPLPQCALDGCENDVRTRQATYCSPKCSHAAMDGTTVRQACTLCEVVFDRPWSSNVRRCAKCRSIHGAGRVSQIGKNHDYGLKHEHFPRGLDG